MTSELPSITAVPAVFGAPSSVTPWTAPKSGPGRSTMIGVGSMMIGVGSMMIGVGSMMIGVGAWIRTSSWIDPPGGAAGLSAGRQMLPSTASAIDGAASAKTAATIRTRDRRPMVLIFPPLILRLHLDPEPVFPGPRERPAGRAFRDHLPEERLAGNDPRAGRPG